jgi:hypothetical protein
MLDPFDPGLRVLRELVAKNPQTLVIAVAREDPEVARWLSKMCKLPVFQVWGMTLPEIEGMPAAVTSDTPHHIAIWDVGENSHRAQGLAKVTGIEVDEVPNPIELILTTGTPITVTTAAEVLCYVEKELNAN